MSPSKRPHDVLSPLNHAAMNANVEGLWKFQLRDENRALLLKIEALEKSARALPAKLDQRFTESTNAIEALVARVAAIEEENRQIKEERRACRDELAGLKERLRALWQQDQLVVNASTGNQQLHREILQQGTAPSVSQHVQKANPPTSLEIPQSKSPAADVPTTSRSVTQMEPTVAPVLNKGNISKAPPKNKTPPATYSSHVKQPAARRPVSRKPNKADGPKLKVPGTLGRKTPPKPTAASKRSPTTFRNLEQGPGGILAYYNTVCKIHAEIGGLDSQGEIEFVDAFIAGIASPIERDDLSSKLEQWHPSRTKKDGNIQLLCRWEDVKEAMVSVGLMAETGGEEDSSRKRRKVLGDVFD